MTGHSTDDAAAQLRRLLVAIPALADDQPHEIADIAQIVGTSVETLRRDLRTLVTRLDDGPGGFMEGVRLAFAADTVQLQSTLFRRPMGLTPSELGALELGLAALAHELPPHEAAVAARARERVAEATMHLGATLPPAATRAAALVGSEVEAAHLGLLRDAASKRCQVLLHYRSNKAPDGAPRTVHTYGLVYASGRWYLVAFCEQAKSVRIFRLDRIVSVTVLDAPASVPEGLDLGAMLHGGVPLTSRTDERLRVHYSSKIARWIAENHAVNQQEDGSVIAEFPLLDDEWAVRHVLQYGPEAHVLGPPRIQELLRERLQALLQEAVTGRYAPPP